jgi:hypothetical protein
MTVVTRDAVAKAVQDEILDLESRSFYLSSLWTSKKGAMGAGQSIDISEIADLSIEDAIDTSYNNVNLTVQNITETATNMIVDQARAVSAEIRSFERLFSNNGALLKEFSGKLQRQIRNDRDSKDFAYLANTIGYDTTATYHLNPASDAVSIDDVENTIANAQTERSGYQGAPFDQLVWMFHPFGIGSVRRLPTWQSNEATMDGQLGLPRVGKLAEIPVYVSQSVQRNRSVATTAVTVTSNVATATVAAGHGLVPGLMIVTSGHTTNATVAVAIQSVTATTVVYALTASNGALADGIGTITDQSCYNALVRRDWLWEATVPDWEARIIPYGRERTSDVIQTQHTWARQSRLAAAFFVHSPAASVS